MNIGVNQKFNLIFFFLFSSKKEVKSSGPSTNEWMLFFDSTKSFLLFIDYPVSFYPIANTYGRRNNIIII